MRAFAAVMAVVVLLLSLLPCSDGDSACSDDHTHTSVIVDAAHPAGATAGLELCTPFCHCNCCHTTVAFLNLDLLPTQPIPTPRKYAHFHDQMESQHQVDIWQPPNA